MADFRSETRRGLDQLFACADSDLAAGVAAILADSAVFDLAHPLPQARGIEAILDSFVRPLRTALRHVRRRDEIVIGGKNIRAPGGHWVVILTHYVGVFDAPLFGLEPSGRLAFLRSGEFYRVERGRITEAKIIFDLPDLARQSGRNPFPPLLGTEMLFPGPATHDGVCPASDGAERSLSLVEAMLGDLHLYDPATGASSGQTGPDGYWHDQMLWYGPGGIGSSYGWTGFVDDHRAAFLTAFPDRQGGNHYCRIGDGDYAAVSGWPSMTMTHAGDYLGVPATGKSLALRVMDFYRCDFTAARGKIAENWVCLDYGDLFAQMGVDLIARANAMA